MVDLQQVIGIVMRHLGVSLFPTAEARDACEAELSALLRTDAVLNDPRVRDMAQAAIRQMLDEPNAIKKLFVNPTEPGPRQMVVPTMIGMPVVSDPKVPPGTVELRTPRERVVISPGEPSGFAPIPDDGKLDE